MNTAIVGVGRMGRRHIQVVRLAGLELTGVFDVSPDSLKLAQDEYALPSHQLFGDLDKLYAEAKPECLIIASTADSHCALTCMAAERGVKFILVEKPLAVSLNECDRMIETCKRHGARLAVNHQMRFMEQYTEPKRMFATEEYGGFASMTVVAGNFGFSMNGTHYFEAFRFLTGEDPVEITAWFSPGSVPNPRGPQFEDRAGCIRAVTASGKRLYMEIGADQGHGIRTIYACRNGMITVNELTGDVVATVREEQYRELPTTRYGMPAVNSQRAIRPAEVIDTSAAVLKALLNDVNSVSGEDGRRVVEILVAAYQSAEQGSVPVRLDKKLDRGRVYPWA
jgi:myo-inositol 2-dehydrogenase / D-chiro-inositol 1-dehydrogenase